MTSHKQSRSNRRNALKSTGPRTPTGKERSSQNSLKHGFTAALRPLPGLEDGEAWEAHVTNMHSTLEPHGYLEETLVDRLAILAWRMGRVVRLENEIAIQRLVDAEEDAARWHDRQFRQNRLGNGPSGVPEPRSNIQDIRLHLEDIEAAQRLIRFIRRPGGRTKVPTEAALVVIYTATDLVDQDIEIDGLLSENGTPSVESCDVWNTRKVWLALEALAQMSEHKQETAVLIPAIIENLDIEARALARQLRDLEAKTTRLRLRRFLPDWETTAHISRYEAHLHRLFIQTLHEFQTVRDGISSGESENLIEIEWAD